MSLLWQAENQHPVISDRDYKRLLRFPVSRPLEGALAENAGWARAWFAKHARPWQQVVLADSRARALFQARLPGAEEIVLIAVSAGPEPEAEAAARWADGEPDRYFFLECLAAAVVEAQLAGVRRRLGVSKHLCPGYTGWPVGENQLLLAELQQAGSLPGPLAVLASGMLTPKKSQLAICAVNRASLPAS
ncbi:MAG: hypothetical protein Q8J74_00830 [Candidatus Didemnitutus sp.]|nr:hypothetical protein [Candidatus Didemnitutus sp.]